MAVGALEAHQGLGVGERAHHELVLLRFLRIERADRSPRSRAENVQSRLGAQTHTARPRMRTESGLPRAGWGRGSGPAETRKRDGCCFGARAQLRGMRRSPPQKTLRSASSRCARVWGARRAVLHDRLEHVGAPKRLNSPELRHGSLLAEVGDKGALQHRRLEALEGELRNGRLLGHAIAVRMACDASARSIHASCIVLPAGNLPGWQGARGSLQGGPAQGLGASSPRRCAEGRGAPLRPGRTDAGSGVSGPFSASSATAATSLAIACKSGSHVRSAAVSKDGTSAQRPGTTSRACQRGFRSSFRPPSCGPCQREVPGKSVASSERC